MSSTFRSGGKDIRISLHEPSTTNAPHPAIVLLHGAGGNVAYWVERLAPSLNEAGLALYAPHYFDRTGTAHADYNTIIDGIHVPQWLEVLDGALTFAAARPSVDPARIAIIGVSLGAFLSLGYAATLSASPDPAARARIRTLVEISGGLESPYNQLATSHFPPTLILHGEADDIVPVRHAHELDARLTQLNVPHETRTFPNEGHWFSNHAQIPLLLAVANFLSQTL